ncbi:MAG: hypothetical protein K8F91_21805 [Candidatus Obscuribacterales bacterium]|nr:hypothetical protein [Candidatus Obscuribacterales bacterium]
MEQFFLNHYVLGVLVGVALTLGGFHFGEKIFSKWFVKQKSAVQSFIVIALVAAQILYLAIWFVWHPMLVAMYGIAVSSFALGLILSKEGQSYLS